MAYPHQKNLYNVVNEIFGENIVSNVRKKASFVNPTSNRYLEIDLWVPEKQICFEFQDSYHYIATWYSHAPLDTIQDKDSLKLALVRERGETLIIVPCWWDGEECSLKATLHHQRPDIVPPVDPLDFPIPLNPSMKFFREEEEIPGIGQLMLASMPEVSNKVFLKSVTTDWWMGEKYDGIRCCWNHVDKKLYSRRGPEIIILSSLSRHLPAGAFVDGEIWFGRGLNAEAQRMAATPEHAPWNQFRLIGFDDPAVPVRLNAFEERYAGLCDVITPNHPFLILAPRVDCKAKSHIMITTKRIIRDGGEGVIMRKHASPYIPGRSSLLYKLKALRGEQEALVVKVERRSVLLRLPDGMTFSVPLDKHQFSSPPSPPLPPSLSPPSRLKNGDSTTQLSSSSSDFTTSIMLKKGDVVTITYDHYSRVTRPANPKIHRKRTDVTWQSVLREYGVVVPSHKLTNKTTLVFNKSKKIKLTNELKKKRMREHLENYARGIGLDPLLPTTWYSTPILNIKGVRGWCQLYHCNSIALMMSLFPDIGLDEDKFPLRPNYYWADEKNRRKFFDDFAKNNNFDPLIAKNWYNVDWNSFYDVKKSFSLIKYYGGSYRRALSHLYPNIGLDEREFTFKPPKYWNSLDNRRDLLIQFAKLNGFDPLSASHWYKIPVTQVEEMKGGQSMMEHYHGSMYRALSQLFPTIHFDQSLFVRNPRYHWREAKNTRIFLDNFAKEHQFDPLIAENWYTVSTLALRKAKGRGILRYYKSLARALIHLYPEVEFEFRKFQHLTKS